MLTGYYLILKETSVDSQFQRFFAFFRGQKGEMTLSTYGVNSLTVHLPFEGLTDSRIKIIILSWRIIIKIYNLQQSHILRLLLKVYNWIFVSRADYFDLLDNFITLLQATLEGRILLPLMLLTRFC